MQADIRVVKEQAVSTQLRRELHDANQKVLQVCCTSPPWIALVTAVVFLNAERCLVTAGGSVRSRCCTVNQHILCCFQDPWQDSDHAFLQF